VEGTAAAAMDDTLKSLSMDYLNLLINGQAFSDVTFSVEGRLVHAHLAARSLFFRKFFCGAAADQAAAAAASAAPGALLMDHLSPRSPSGASASSPRAGGTGSAVAPAPGAVIPVNSVSYEVFLLLLQFLYSGQVSLVPQKGEPRPGCGERGCWHTHCAAAVDLALDTLAAARSFGVEELAILTQVNSQLRFFPSFFSSCCSQFLFQQIKNYFLSLLSIHCWEQEWLVVLGLASILISAANILRFDTTHLAF
jgi:regulatory protein NPR1